MINVLRVRLLLYDLLSTPASRGRETRRRQCIQQDEDQGERVCEAIEGRSQLCVSKRRRGTDGSDVPAKGRALTLGPWVLYYVMICCWYGVGGGVGGSFRR